MIGLLVLQSLVVFAFGIETRNRRLETLSTDLSSAAAASLGGVDGLGPVTSVPARRGKPVG